MAEVEHKTQKQTTTVDHVTEPRSHFVAEPTTQHLPEGSRSVAGYPITTAPCNQILQTIPGVPETASQVAENLHSQQTTQIDRTLQLQTQLDRIQNQHSTTLQRNRHMTTKNDDLKRITTLPTTNSCSSRAKSSNWRRQQAEIHTLRRSPGAYPPDGRTSTCHY